MYRRAYPPRNTPLPENYSGIALLSEEEETAGEPTPEEETAERTPLPEPEPEHFSAPEREEEAPKAEACEASAKPTLPPSFATGDMLLLAVAALVSQSGQADGELLVILLLLLLSE